MESPSQMFEPGHLVEAVVHFNEALARIDRESPAAEVADLMFRCLNKLQTGRRFAAQQGEVAGFKELVRLATSTESRRSRFFGRELRVLTALEPQIMNHDVLRQGDYRPGLPINAQLKRAATEEHRKLINALQRLDDGTTPEAIDQVVKRSAELLYVVRSNIVHGEKTPYGPDLDKRERDESVCRAVVPLCHLLVDLLLEQPSHRLIAYGTLAPGGANHGVVEHLDGRWRPCTVEAVLIDGDGLQVMSWQPGISTKIEAMLLDSDALPAHWERIDRFEGAAYRRLLVPVWTKDEDGSCNTVVASAYVGPGDQLIMG